MLLLGHLGFTLGAAQAAETAQHNASRRRGFPGSNFVDYRLIAVGAMLPELIDKPLMLLPLPEVLDVSRTFGHSLLLPLLLLVLWRAGSVRMRRATLTLGLASLLHLVLDAVLSTSQTLLWPGSSNAAVHVKFSPAYPSPGNCHGI